MAGLFEDLIKKELIIFDFDGVIVYLKTDWKRLKNELEEYCKREYRMKIKIKRMNELIEYVTKHIDKNFQSISESIIKKYELANISNFKENKEVIELIKKLKGKSNLVILSNNCLATINTVLNKIGLANTFISIVSREAVGMPKPHTEGIKKILEYFPNIDKKKVFLIGNKIEDKLCAKKIGIDYMLI